MKLNHTRPTLSRTNFLITLITLVIALTIIGYLWIHDKRMQFENNIAYLKQSYITEKKTIIKAQVEDALQYIKYNETLVEERLKNELQSHIEDAHNIATGIYEKFKGKESDEKIQAFIKEALRGIRFFDGRGYFYVYDMKGVCMMHPIKPQIEGTDKLYHFKDASGTYPVREIIKTVSENDKGFVNFYFFRPGSTEQEPKLSYNILFKPYDWFIGTGEYEREVRKEIQGEITRRLRGIRYENDGYLFIYAKDGTSIMHPVLPEMEGKNHSQLLDPTGKNIFSELLQASQNGEGGFVEYLWTHPGLGENLPKLTYAAFIKEWDWMIGSGLYMHQIDEIITEKRVALQNEINKRILNIVFIILIITVVAIITLQVHTYYIKRSFNVFSKFFNKASTENTQIDTQQVSYKEFIDLAQLANKMLESRAEIEQKLQANERKVMAMSQAVEDALVMIDGQGKVMFWNPAAEKMFGYTAAEAMGIDFHGMAVSEETKTMAWAGFEHFNKTGDGPVIGTTIEHKARNKNGREFPVEVTVSSFQIDDEWFAVGTVRDITIRKNAEEDMQKNLEDLERFSTVAIGREEKMIKLKEEINELLAENDKAKKYKIVE